MGINPSTNVALLTFAVQDAIELSDDSDIEVHPNVDKKSFIRAKQAQIHRDRAQRKHRITTLKFEREVNDGLLARIDLLLAALESHKPEPGAQPNAVDEIVLLSLVESGVGRDDQPPTPPPGLYDNQADRPTYSKMTAAVVDMVKKRVDEKKPENRFEAFAQGIRDEKSTIQDMQKKLMDELIGLEKEEKKHITSDDIHTGFDKSQVCLTSRGSVLTTIDQQKRTASSQDYRGRAAQPYILRRRSNDAVVRRRSGCRRRRGAKDPSNTSSHEVRRDPIRRL